MSGSWASISPRSSAQRTVQTMNHAMNVSASGLGQYVSSGTAVADTTVQRVLNIFGLRGKAFSSAFWISLPAAVLALVVRVLADADVMPFYKSSESNLLSINAAVWSGITGVLGFLIVFRASQAYGRYWQALTAIHSMQAEWFDACGSIVTFCSTSDDLDLLVKVRYLKNVMVRLFSLLHAAALLRLIEPGAADHLIGEIPLVGPTSLDQSCFQAFEQSSHRVELVSQWIQNWTMRALHEGVISAPAPIVSRSYQAFLFTFFQTFTLWSLSRVSATIEVPFSLSDFVTDAITLQRHFNEQLQQLLHPAAVSLPHINLEEIKDEDPRSKLQSVPFNAMSRQESPSEKCFPSESSGGGVHNSESPSTARRHRHWLHQRTQARVLENSLEQASLQNLDHDDQDVQVGNKRVTNPGACRIPSRASHSPSNGTISNQLGSRRAVCRVEEDTNERDRKHVKIVIPAATDVQTGEAEDRDLEAGEAEAGSENDPSVRADVQLTQL